ncbi:MAG: hypothetical protein A3I07_01205 [Candidatus Doudnabacteria bacterium RIFCSPLOWO2_02_FULL_42_9]|uniref:Uncharacterized protein n=1 Tax=Candidatus Doudnabacteria bacterium RIFCSPHIGHO2_01_FULL_41_86 TaxID=1817821 RepID=A0A1F5N8M8_9BACT|nr:MAG: hypothetical protein A2717_00770 [Candidatus Doudnabacteria bacterium RIFCSPHIGHO2_01_FULL_41_86]OGE75376.1 MAG: hypothetical protein A3K07_01280 [Candidatus Doudnabacteria bacterium RIFCSPHIGHO2_01_43_10]OGE86597.1 MAG: hypothetical protein A3E28_04285 [Candidatus Doudnabacteria bacterium RIFCSPHIGHO2_12_FULL_42_22]OGE87497.1 MAG: hypothetical protein A3C49_03945 [Candidatus Doudnabacteria bacterium RIFCSPHIGHO2_02_FULL_42_25]OGE92768.1 MAG: hypothetical protein A2895_04570 [Candidatus
MKVFSILFFVLIALVPCAFIFSWLILVGDSAHFFNDVFYPIWILVFLLVYLFSWLYRTNHPREIEPKSLKIMRAIGIIIIVLAMLFAVSMFYSLYKGFGG